MCDARLGARSTARRGAAARVPQISVNSKTIQDSAKSLKFLPKALLLRFPFSEGVFRNSVPLVWVFLKPNFKKVVITQKRIKIEQKFQTDSSF